MSPRSSKCCDAPGVSDHVRRPGGRPGRRRGPALSCTVLLAAALLGAGLGLGACASAPKDAGFGAVREAVSRRTGESLVWYEDGEDAAAVRGRVRSLLADGLTADRAVAVALVHSHRLQATLADLGIARADLLEAGLLRNPVLGGEIRYPGAPVRPFEISVLQSFMDIFELPLRKRVAAAEFEETKLKVADAAASLAADARAQFYEVQAAEEAVSLRRGSAEAAGSAAELARRQRAAGNINALDLEAAEALLEGARLELARAQVGSVLARERLNRLMGVWGPETEWRVIGDLPDPPREEPSAEGLEAVALAQRLDVLAARARVDAAARVRGVARLEKLGELSLGAHREGDARGGVATGPAVQISVPVFNRGQASALRALAELRRSRERLEALTVEARSEVRAAHARLLAARGLVDYYHGSVVPRRQRIVAETQLEYNGMLVGTLQLLQARQGEIEAERQAVESLRDYWQARSELERAVGGRLVLDGVKKSAPEAGLVESGGTR